jgi:hypothetical protein
MDLGLPHRYAQVLTIAAKNLGNMPHRIKIYIF